MSNRRTRLWLYDLLFLLVLALAKGSTSIRMKISSAAFSRR
jgi:hypothetical protein